MFFFAHRILVLLYVVLPVVVLLVGIVQMRRTKRSSILWMLILSTTAGTGFGVSLGYLYTKAVHGTIIPTQIFLAAYFATAMLLLLKMIDGVLLQGLRRMLKVPAAGAPGETRASSQFRPRVAMFIRAVLVIAFGLPYVMAAILTYRPKVGLDDDPTKQLGYPFEPVTFHSTDGLRLEGWWMPAHAPDAKHPTRPGQEWGKETVIVCHGLGANKANQLILARAFPPNGYNALIFDFRAHGNSGGQITSFGDLERRDVLGAVRFVRDRHPGESHRILGVGASMGAAALISAAADPSDEGRAIGAVAVYATYDSISHLAQEVSDTYFPPPLNWLTVHIGVPMASLQTGVDLNQFAPVRELANLWPRPILVIHGSKDEIIPTELGHHLFDAATQPKQRLWITDGGHNDVINDEGAAKVVIKFFDTATAVPVI